MSPCGTYVEEENHQMVQHDLQYMYYENKTFGAKTVAEILSLKIT